jgi:hypothetical protein
MAGSWRRSAEEFVILFYFHSCNPIFVIDIVIYGLNLWKGIRKGMEVQPAEYLTK